MTVDSPVEYPANEPAARLAQSEEWRKLLRHFDLNEGFAFALLLVPDSLAAEICERELKRILGRCGKGLLPVRFQDAKALRDLPSTLLDLQPAQSDAAVWVATAVPAGTPQYEDWRDAWRQTAARLNENRNPLRRQLNLTLLFVGAPWLQEVLREYAPDLWSVRTLVVEIPSRFFTPAVLVRVGSQNLRKIPELSDEDRTSGLDSLDPSIALKQAARLWGRPRQKPALALMLVRAAEGFTGRRQFGEATGAYREAAKIYRELAAQEPDTYLPYLAMSLNNLGVCLRNLGRLGEALVATEEAVRIRRQLARERPDAFLADLAGSLNNLAQDLSGLGRREEPLAAAEEAVRIYRRLASERPDVFLPTLAGSLNNVGAFLNGLGRSMAALAVAEEAVRIYRKLAVERPDAHLRDLAMSLSNQANGLSGLGRREEALAAVGEAVRIYRKLAGEDPDAFLPDLAKSLNNLSSFLSELDQRKEALVAAEESVRIRRQLARERPDAFPPDLARSLGTLALCLRAVDHREKACEAFHEALVVLCPYFEALPAAFTDLAAGLTTEYVTECEQLGQETDSTLLDRFVQVFEKLEQAASKDK